MSCSLQCTVSVDSSFTIRLCGPFFLIITQKGFVIVRPTRTIIETKRRFPQNLGGRENCVVLTQHLLDLSNRARPPNVRTTDPTCITYLRSDGLVCLSLSDFGKADRHHHYVHTRHLALPLVSRPPFFALNVPLPYRFRIKTNSTKICPCVLSQKPRRETFLVGKKCKGGLLPHLSLSNVCRGLGGPEVKTSKYT